MRRKMQAVNDPANIYVVINSLITLNLANNVLQAMLQSTWASSQIVKTEKRQAFFHLWALASIMTVKVLNRFK